MPLEAEEYSQWTGLGGDFDLALRLEENTSTLKNIEVLASQTENKVHMHATAAGFIEDSDISSWLEEV